MQTQDSQLKEIQAGNEQVRKKLEVFRSGLQKLMSKKSSKKQQRNEAPSHDTKLSLANQSYSNQYNMNKQSPVQVQKGQNQQQFGFNSTLFRQINDETVLSNNSSGVNEMYQNHNRNKSQQDKYSGQYDKFDNNYGGRNVKNYDSPMGNTNNYGSSFGNGNTYGSVGSGNSQNPNEYFSTSSKKNNQPQNYDYSTTFNGTNKNIRQLESRESQSFKKSSLLFSQIDHLMNKVNNSSKLPIKPIQKYINQQQSKIMTDNRQIDFTLLSNSSLILSQTKREKYSSQQIGGNQRIDQDKKNKSQKREQTKSSKLIGKKGIDQATSFIKNMKQRSSSLIENKRQKSSSLMGIKQPPLPPSQPIKMSNKSKEQKKQQQNRDDYLEWGKKISSNIKQQYQRQQIDIKIDKQQVIMNVQQRIGNKIKSTLSERKKLIRQEGLMMDETIQLQLSSQQQDEDRVVQQNMNLVQEQIKILQQQKQRLLNQLKQVQSQLQQLQSTL